MEGGFHSCNPYRNLLPRPAQTKAAAPQVTRARRFAAHRGDALEQFQKRGLLLRCEACDEFVDLPDDASLKCPKCEATYLEGPRKPRGLMLAR